VTRVCHAACARVPVIARRRHAVIVPGYFIFAIRSASSSQLLIARMTFSLAGMPFGNSFCRSASRSTDPSRLARARGELPTARLVRRRRVLVVAVADVARPLVRRFARLWLTAPTTPCACLRWAPSAAARVNVRPHSGHLNSSAVLAFLRCRAIRLPPGRIAMRVSIRVPDRAASKVAPPSRCEWAAFEYRDRASVSAWTGGCHTAPCDQCSNGRTGVVPLHRGDCWTDPLRRRNRQSLERPERPDRRGEGLRRGAKRWRYACGTRPYKGVRLGQGIRWGDQAPSAVAARAQVIAKLASALEACTALVGSGSGRQSGPLHDADCEPIRKAISAMLGSSP
jgi:hypothetical protein